MKCNEKDERHSQVGAKCQGEQAGNCTPGMELPSSLQGSALPWGTCRDPSPTSPLPQPYSPGLLLPPLPPELEHQVPALSCHLSLSPILSGPHPTFLLALKNEYPAFIPASHLEGRKDMGGKPIEIWDDRGIGAELQRSDTDVAGRGKAFGGGVAEWLGVISGGPGELQALDSERHLF